MVFVFLSLFAFFVFFPVSSSSLSLAFSLPPSLSGALFLTLFLLLIKLASFFEH